MAWCTRAWAPVQCTSRSLILWKPILSWIVFGVFSCRRGQPDSIFSDQATTFISAGAQLTRGLLEVSKKVIDAYAVSKGITWNFNPPTASHMGGAWERMIGMIRRIMAAILPRTVLLTVEILETLFCEVESMINCRPLTKLNDDPDDPTPLTPNHL